MRARGRSLVTSFMPCEEERLHPPAPPGCKAATGNSRGSHGCSRAGDTKETRKISSHFSGSFPPLWPPSHHPPTQKICILHSSLLSPEKQHKIQLQASAQSCNVSLQTCKSKAINQPTRKPFSYLSAQEFTPLISSQQHKIKPSDLSTGTSGLSPSIQGLRDPLLPLPHPAFRPAAPHLATT